MPNKENAMEIPFFLEPTPATMPERAQPPTERQTLTTYRQMTVERIESLKRQLDAENRYLDEIDRKLLRAGP